MPTNGQTCSERSTYEMDGDKESQEVVTRPVKIESREIEDDGTRAWML